MAEVEVDPSIEGAALAAAGLLLMATGTIFFGALRSVGRSKSSKSYDESETPPEIIRSREAARCPVVASCFLLGVYALFKVFPQEVVDLALGALSFFYVALGVLALSHTVRPLVAKVLPTSKPSVNGRYERLLTQTFRRTFGLGEADNNKEELVSVRLDVACLVPCAAVGLWYLLAKHWVANNLLGLALSLNGVEMLHLNDVPTGCVFLGGLFVYDVFWVFATDVMLTVATSVDGPIKLVFPLDLPERGLFTNAEVSRDLAMLGLGDIVIPGMFAALLLRFDVSLDKNGGSGRRTYFCTSFLAYVVGAILAGAASSTFKCAQPGLLYMVPVCVGLPLTVALFRGELAAMFAYDETSPPPEETEEEPRDKSDTEKR